MVGLDMAIMIRDGIEFDYRGGDQLRKDLAPFKSLNQVLLSYNSLDGATVQ
jgi:hypothetical protein